MKKLLALLLCVPMLCLAVPAMADITKDETVYALLDADGTMGQVLVVSHMETPQAGVYVDYGTYTDVSAMTMNVQPEIEGDAITWTLPENAEGFFAVGSLQTAELPFLLSVSATVDGAPVSTADLAGRSGPVGLTLRVTHNENVSAAYAGYMAQLQVPLSLSVVSNVHAVGQTTSLVGQTYTLTYTILPGADAEFTITFDAVDFSMDGMTMACLPMDIGQMLGLDIGGIAGQTSTLVGGANELAAGGLQLADGLQAFADGTEALAEGADSMAFGAAALSDGLTQLSGAIGSLPAQVHSLADGLSQAADGATAYVAGVGNAIDATAQLSAALGEISENGEALVSAFAQMQEALAPMLAQLPEAQRTAVQAQMAQLAEAATAYTGGVQTIAGQTAMLSDSLSPLTDGGTQLTDGLSQASAGIGLLSGGLQALATQTEALPAQGEALSGGARELADGIGSLHTQTPALAQAARQLADGQQALADGTGEAIATLEGLSSLTEDTVPLHSFASAEHEARSVQFIYQTEAIRLPAQTDTVSAAETSQTFWTRLVNLFK